MQGSVLRNCSSVASRVNSLISHKVIKKIFSLLLGLWNQGALSFNPGSADYCLYYLGESRITLNLFSQDCWQKEIIKEDDDVIGQ